MDLFKVTEVIIMDNRRNPTAINWYPGHMTKTRRMIESGIGDIDIVVEMVDARIPLASKNPDIERLAADKKKLLILNKSDLADPAENDRWTAYYKSRGYAVIKNNSLKTNTTPVLAAIKELFREKAEKYAEKGVKNKAVRIMMRGIPNVGKSTLINSLSGEKRAKTEDRPGVTRTKQWIHLKENISLLDTPGILWPKLENQHQALNLAISGAIKDTVLDIEEIAAKLAQTLANEYPQALRERYKIEFTKEDAGYQLLEKIGKKRGFIVRGGEIDTERAAIILLDEFRSGKIGKITLEKASLVADRKD